MPIYDITVPIEPATAVYPGDPTVRLTRLMDVGRGDAYTFSAIQMGLHTATHVDAPAHYFADGVGVESLPLDVLIGPAVVLDATGEQTDLDGPALERVGLTAAQRLIFKTASPTQGARPGIGLLPDAARRLVDAGVKLIGIDALSCAPLDDPGPTHRILLEAGVVIVEGLDLDGVPAGRYDLICLPLLIPGADGAPARVLLVGT